MILSPDMLYSNTYVDMYNYKIYNLFFGHIYDTKQKEHMPLIYSKYQSVIFYRIKNWSLI